MDEPRHVMQCIHRHVVVHGLPLAALLADRPSPGTHDGSCFYVLCFCVFVFLRFCGCVACAVAWLGAWGWRVLPACVAVLVLTRATRFVACSPLHPLPRANGTATVGNSDPTVAGPSASASPDALRAVSGTIMLIAVKQLLGHLYGISDAYAHEQFRATALAQAKPSTSPAHPWATDMSRSRVRWRRTLYGEPHVEVSATGQTIERPAHAHRPPQADELQLPKLVEATDRAVHHDRRMLELLRRQVRPPPRTQGGCGPAQKG